MEYTKFLIIFMLVHTFSYVIAGAIALQFSRDIYESKSRHCTFLRDMSDEEEKKYVSKLFLPAQLIRGILMAAVLFPILEAIKDLSTIKLFIFFGLLMFIYTHLAAASPFIDNIEGFVYFKKEYLKKKFFIKFQMEMIIYCVIFGAIMSLVL